MISYCHNCINLASCNKNQNAKFMSHPLSSGWWSLSTIQNNLMALWYVLKGCTCPSWLSSLVSKLSLLVFIVLCLFTRPGGKCIFTSKMAPTYGYWQDPWWIIWDAFLLVVSMPPFCDIKCTSYHHNIINTLFSLTHFIFSVYFFSV